LCRFHSSAWHLMQSVKRLGSLAASNRQIPPVTKGGSGTLLTPAWSGQRRKRQEEGYEQLIVSAARVIVALARREERPCVRSGPLFVYAGAIRHDVKLLVDEAK
jgi:hypothetical protein